MREQLLGVDASKALAFQTVAVKHFGADGGIFIRQLLYRDGSGKDEDFWIYKSMEEWQEETGLSRRGQERARKRLIKADVMEEKKALIHGRRTLHFRVKSENLMERVGDDLPHAKPSTSGTDCTPSRTGSLPTVGGDHADSRQGITEDYSEDNPEEFGEVLSLRSSTSPASGISAKSAASPSNDFHDHFPGDLQAIRLHLEYLVEQAMDDFADPEALKSDADEAGYYFMSNAENVTTKEQHAIFGAISAAKAKISAATSFGEDPDPQRKNGSDEAVKDLSSVYVASSIGEALLRAIDEADDEDKRRGFEKLLLQWRHARDKESPESPPDGPVTAADGPARPVHHPVHQNRVQGILDAVEIKDF